MAALPEGHHPAEPDDGSAERHGQGVPERGGEPDGVGGVPAGFDIERVRVDRILSSTRYALSFETVLGDMMDVFRKKTYLIEPAWMSAKLFSNPVGQVLAAAWRETFDRARVVFDPRVRLVNAPIAADILQRMHRCKPVGVEYGGIANKDKPKYACYRSLLCPWCRMRNVQKIIKKAWCELHDKVYVCYRRYDFSHVVDYEYAAYRLAGDRMTHFRTRCCPTDTNTLRLRRIGVDIAEDGHLFIRMLHTYITSKPPHKLPKDYRDLRSMSFREAIKQGLRYSEQNLLAPPEWIRGLIPLSGCNSFEFSSVLSETEQVNRYNKRMSQNPDDEILIDRFGKVAGSGRKFQF